MFQQSTAAGLYCKFSFAYNEVFYHTILSKDNILYAVLHYIGATENAPKYKYKG
jgi:hypothetical protein